MMIDPNHELDGHGDGCFTPLERIRLRELKIDVLEGVFSDWDDAHHASMMRFSLFTELEGPQPTWWQWLNERLDDDEGLLDDDEGEQWVA